MTRSNVPAGMMKRKDSTGYMSPYSAGDSHEVIGRQ